MNAIIKLIAAGLAGAALAALCAWGLSGSTVVADLRRYLFDEPAREAVMVARADQVRLYEAARDQLARDLIAGRLALPDAVAELERLDAAFGFPALEDTRQRVLWNVRMALRDRPSHELEAVLAWLEATPGDAACG